MKYKLNIATPKQLEQLISDLRKIKLGYLGPQWAPPSLTTGNTERSQGCQINLPDCLGHITCHLDTSPAKQNPKAK